MIVRHFGFRAVLKAQRIAEISRKKLVERLRPEDVPIRSRERYFLRKMFPEGRKEPILGVLRDR